MSTAVFDSVSSLYYARQSTGMCKSIGKNKSFIGIYGFGSEEVRFSVLGQSQTKTAGRPSTT